VSIDDRIVIQREIYSASDAVKEILRKAAHAGKIGFSYQKKRFSAWSCGGGQW
jgi:hypothetical protein